MCTDVPIYIIIILGLIIVKEGHSLFQVILHLQNLYF